METQAHSLALALLQSAGEDPRRSASILATLERFGQPALAFAIRAEVRVVPLRRAQRYLDASAALARLGLAVDDWPAPPSGLFVVEERCVYLRSRSPMTVAHEFGHALDCALGGGVYRSGIDPQLRACFARARAFVTPYAATGIDEYFAEALRAYVEANDESSPWPKATRDRLLQVDRALFDYVDNLFRFGFSRELAA